MKTNNKLLIVLFWGLFSVFALQQTNYSMADNSIQQLHIFKHSEKALADEVNQNFEFLDNKINDINSQLSLNKQEIGIGIDKPNAYLHVLDTNIDNTNLLFLEFTAGNVGTLGEEGALLRINSNSFRRPLLSLNSPDPKSITRMSNKVFISAAGRVGIGTTTPLSELDVNGNLTLRNPLNEGYTGSTIHFTFRNCPGPKIKSSLRWGLCSKGQSDLVLSSFYEEDKNEMRITNGRVEVAGKIQANSLVETSDIQFKKSIMPLNNSLEKISLLKGVSYFWKTEEYPHKNFDDSKQIGLIAQEVEPIISEVVRTDTDGYKSISYDRLTAVLVEAVKELKTINEKQDQHIKNQKEQIEKHQQEINELKSLVKQLLLKDI